MSYRVVYGETMPAWERIFPTMRAAKAFAKEHEGFGDIVFSVKKVVPDEAPQCLTAAAEAGAVDEFIERARRELASAD
jgi:hypothetical protein